MNLHSNSRGDAASNDRFYGGRCNVLMPRMQELGRVNLGPRKLRLPNNNRSFGVIDEDAVRTSLISGRLKFLGGIGLGCCAREIFGSWIKFLKISN